MIKYFLILISLLLIMFNVSFGQQKTILQYNEKTTLADTDEFIISEADTDYYKHSFANLKTGIRSMSGTWSGSHTFSNIITGSITGNAVTVTNGMYLTGTNTTSSGAVYNYVNSTLSIDGTSIISVAGGLAGGTGSSWLLPTSIPTTHGLIGRVGSSGSGLMLFNYGTSLTDTMATLRYLRNNLPTLGRNNTWSGTNLFNGAVTCSSTVALYGATSITGATLSIGSTSVLDVNGRLNLPALTSTDAYDIGLESETADRIVFNYGSNLRDTVASLRKMRADWVDMNPKLDYEVLTPNNGNVSISSNSSFLVIDGASGDPATNITSITGGATGKRITILCKPDDANGFTITDGASISTITGATLTLGAGDVVEFICYGTGWFQCAAVANN